MALSLCKDLFPDFLRIAVQFSPTGRCVGRRYFLDDGSLDVNLGVLEKLDLKRYLISIFKISLLYL